MQTSPRSGLTSFKLPDGRTEGELPINRTVTTLVRKFLRQAKPLLSQSHSNIAECNVANKFPELRSKVPWIMIDNARDREIQSLYPAVKDLRVPHKGMQDFIDGVIKKCGNVIGASKATWRMALRGPSYIWNE